VAPLPFRYSSNSGKRPRGGDDRSNNGIPIFVQERCEERQQKRVSLFKNKNPAAALLGLKIFFFF
jgi:hypothetical protein